MTELSPPLLNISAVEKRYGGVHALRGANFELRSGEVHALLGENGAGKSTLINILSGVVSADAGTIAIAGAPQEFGRPADAQAAGIATIHQELDLVPEMSVAENLFLGREPRTALRLLDRRRQHRDARELLARAGIAIDPARRVSALRVGEQQMVEIAKALAFDARIIVMDEPTSALADTEVERLFGVIADLRAQGIGVVYVSHRLEEVDLIGDRATVLRDGANVGTVELADTTRSELIEMMVGQPLHELFPKADAKPGEALLVLKDLRVRPRVPRPGRSEPDGISLTVRSGEVVGLAGLMGSGRTELLETLYGAGPPGRREGVATLAGRPLDAQTPRAGLAAGIGLVPEDRKGAGLVLGQSITSNATIAALERFSRLGFVARSRERTEVARTIAELQIKTPSAAAAVGTLSGGNQQKVVFAKELLTQPRLLLLDEPTRGVDVGAKAEIYRLMAELAADGLGILVASSELPELLGICDRIVVLRRGAVALEVDAAAATQQLLLEAATGAEEQAA